MGKPLLDRNYRLGDSVDLCTSGSPGSPSPMSGMSGGEAGKPVGETTMFKDKLIVVPGLITLVLSPGSRDRIALDGSATSGRHPPVGQDRDLKPVNIIIRATDVTGQSVLRILAIIPRAVPWCSSVAFVTNHSPGTSTMARNLWLPDTGRIKFTTATSAW